MCWISDNITLKKIAERDFYVYKIGQVMWDNIFISYIKKYQYIPKCSNITIPLILATYGAVGDVIREGYHSYKWVALDNTRPGNKCLYLGNYISSLKVSLEEYRYCCVGTFIIPKGAEYFENKYGYIVSSDIIYTGKYLRL